MNDLLRKLPIGIQTFEKLRKGDYLYRACMENSLYIYSILPESSTPFLVKVFFSLPLKPTLKERKNSSKGLPLKNWKRNGKSILCCIWI